MAEEETKKLEIKEEEKEEQKKPGAEEKKQEAKKPEEKPKAEKKEEKKIEKEFTIPLRRKFKNVPRYKKTPKAIRTIKEFLVKHMKLYDRDLNKVKIDKYLNEFIWTRGIRHPPARIKVKVTVEGDIVRAELSEMSEKMKFKKGKLEKRETKMPIPEKKKEAEKPVVTEEAKEEKAEEKKKEKEKQAAVIEAGKKMEKATAKQARHMGKEKPMQPKRQRRMALEK